MKKAIAPLAAIFLAACTLPHCAKEPDATTRPGACTIHFKYGQLLRVLEDPDGQEEAYRDAARFYCFTESDHQWCSFRHLTWILPTSEPLTLTDQLLEWNIDFYQGPQEHYAGDAVVRAWFSDTVTRSNFDFTFRLRFNRRSP